MDTKRIGQCVKAVALLCIPFAIACNAGSTPQLGSHKQADSSTQLSTDLSEYALLAPITITYSGMPGTGDPLITIAHQGSPDTSDEQYYLPGSQTSGTIVAHNIPPGTFVVRAYFDSSYTLQAESAPFIVDPATWGASVSTDLSIYPHMAPITVTYSGMSGAASDAIFIAKAGTPEGSYEQFQLLYGSINGTVVFYQLPPGNYVARAYYDDYYSLNQVAESAPFTIQPVSWSSSLSIDATTFSAGMSVPVHYSGMSGSYVDMITIAQQGSDDLSYVQFKFTGGALNGTLSFDGLPVGTYVARAYYDDDSVNYYNSGTKKAESVPFTIANAPTVSLSTDQSAYTLGASVNVSFGGMLGSSTDWISIASAGSDDDTYVSHQFTGAVVNGSITFEGLPEGSYVARAYFSDSFAKEAESTAFTITAPEGSAGAGDRGTPLVASLLSVVATETNDDTNLIGMPVTDDFPLDAPISVSADGAATVHIPLWVPPGRNGIQPELSLDYNSRAGRSIVGYGWQLSGLSMINRCTTAAADSGHDARAIKFDSSDQLCLDGDPLVPETPQATVFRTLHDSFRRIVAGQSDALGPTGFVAFQRDGRVLTFSAVTSPRHVVVPAGTVSDGDSAYNDLSSQVRYAWVLTGVQDQSGNHMDIEWVPQPEDSNPDINTNQYSEFLPAQIAWTENQATGLIFTKHILFNYNQPVGMPSTWPSSFTWQSGVQIRQDHLLTSITVMGPNADAASASTLKTYFLTYTSIDPLEPIQSYRRPSLQSVYDCEGAVICKPPLTFDYDGDVSQLPSQEWTDLATSVTNVERVPQAAFSWPARIYTPDLNGDGRSDLVYLASDASGYKVQLSNGTMAAPSLTQQFAAVTDASTGSNTLDFVFDSRLFPFDYEGDGVTDLFLTIDQSTQGSPCCGKLLSPLSASGSNFVFHDRTSELPSFISAGEVADLNGDGLADLIWSQSVPIDRAVYSPPQSAVSLSWTLQPNGGGSFPAVVGSSFSSPNDHLFVDVDGDGSFELLTKGASFSDRYSATFANGDVVPTTLDLSVPYVFADINGDGLADALYFGDSVSNSVVAVRFNLGAGFAEAVVVPLSAAIDVFSGTRRVIDFNKDGKQDILIRPRSDTTPDPFGQAGCPAEQLCMFVLWYDGAQFQVTPILPDPDLTGHHGIPLYGTDSNAEESAMTEVMDVNGDGLDDIVMLNGGVLHVYVRGQAPTTGKLLRTLTRAGVRRNYNSVSEIPGVQYKIDYKPISDPTVYQPDAAHPSSYPQSNVDSKIWVVSQISRSPEQWVGDFGNHLQYQYVGGRGDQRGRGFLGFEQVVESRVESNTGTTTTYDLSQHDGQTSFYPLAGFPIKTETTVGDQTFSYDRTVVRTPFIVKTTVSGGANDAFFVYASSTSDYATIEDNAVPSILHNVLTAEYRDSYGNLRNQHVAREDTSYDEVNHMLSYTTDPWPGIANDTVTTSSFTPAAGLLSRVTQLDYDTHWRLVQCTDLPGQTDLGAQTLITTIVPTDEGLVGSITMAETEARGGASRQVSLTYDSAERMFPSVQQDSLGHIVRRAYHPGFGVVTVEEDENAQQTNLKYDGFMRLRSLTRPTGDVTTYSYSTHQGDPDAPYNSASTIMRVVENHNNRDQLSGEKTIAELGWRGQIELVRRWNRIDGQAVFTGMDYDLLDRAYAYSRPAFAAGFNNATVVTYDNLNRVQHVDLADGTTRSNTFYGLSTVHTDGNLNAFQTTIVDGRGRLVKSIETSDGSDSQTTLYSYGPFNTLHIVTDTNGNAFQTDVNRLGQPYHQSDKDGGERYFSYNAFGEVETTATQEFNKRFIYDEVGRVRQEQNTSLGTTTTFRWDTAVNGIGKLGSATSPDNISTTFEYTPSGQLSNKHWHLQTPLGFETYTMSMDYDPLGRMSSLTYPTTPGGALTLRYQYGEGGQLQSIYDQTEQPLWTLIDSDPSGAFTTEAFRDGTTVTQTESTVRLGTLGNLRVVSGNGATLHDVSYSRDRNSNIIGRTDNLNNQTEGFGYDWLNRLTSWDWFEGGSVQEEIYQYDALGNLRARNIAQGTGTNRVFNTDPSGLAGPHQIIGGTTNYGYDRNGRQTSSAGRTIAYTDFDLPAFISTASGKQVSFSYDANKQRTVKTWMTGDYTVDLDELFEHGTVNGVATDVMSVFANGKHVVAVVNTGGDAQVLNVVGDHLGSTQLVTRNCSGINCLAGSEVVVDRLKYEPFGARIGFDLPLQQAGAPASGFRTGFAEQSQDDEPSLNLIDMKGRVYDPTQARFLSPDPIVDQPESGQSFNPYSYVWNNPLNYRDETGFAAECHDDPSGWGVTCTLTPDPPPKKSPDGDAFPSNSVANASSGYLQQPAAKGGAGDDARNAGMASSLVTNSVRNAAFDLATQSAQKADKAAPIVMGAAFGVPAVGFGVAVAPAVAAGIGSVSLRVGVKIVIHAPWAIPLGYNIGASVSGAPDAPPGPANSFEHFAGGPGAGRVPTPRELLTGGGLARLASKKLPAGTGYSMEELLNTNIVELGQMLDTAKGPLRQALKTILKLARESKRLVNKGGDL